MVRVIRRVSLVIAALAFIWAAWLILVGGGTINLLGVRLSSNEPLRPFTIGCVVLAAYVLLGGRLPSRPAWLPGDRMQAIALSLGVTVFGITYATTAASGSDPYGYVSQADLWIAGDLHVEQPWVAQAPWPSKAWSFAPLGYRPLDDNGTLVPTYPSGLALLMAAAKTVAGQEAMFWIAPIAGGVLVLATYGIGRRMAPPGAALVAAWLVATCPVMLYMLVQPMTDVPVAAAWVSAAYLLLRQSIGAAGLAGVAAAVGLLIRPNLIILVPVLALWPLWLADRDTRRAAVLQMLVFCAGASVGAVAVAVINQHLYGSPLAFGHGDPGAFFDPSHVLPNLARYGSWLVTSQTVAAVAGLAVLLVPWRHVWPATEQRRFPVMAAAVVVTVWLFYCFYLVFDEWWYLRFLLPALPFIAIGTGAVVMALRHHGGRTAALAAIGIVLVVMTQYRFAVSHGVTDFWSGERRYVGVARIAAGMTDDHSVFFSLQHCGSMRYYGGRTTIRFDLLDGHSLDQAVEWLRRRGVRSYLLVEEWEIAQFRGQFAGQSTVARLDAPLAVIQGDRYPATLFDLNQHPGAEVQQVRNPVEGLRSVPPAAPSKLTIQTGTPAERQSR